MLFNSYDYLVYFLPIAALGYFALGRNPRWSVGWLVAASLVFYGWWNPRYVPLILVIGVVGIAFALAALQVFVRDVEHVLMPILMILMYLTPILYPLSLVPANLRGVVAANPFGWIVARLREALLEGQLAVHASDAIALVVALLLFAGGRWVFRRLSPHFEDFV